VRVLGELPGEEARRRIRLRAAMADHWCPRSAAVHALVHDRAPESYALLVALLDEDEPAVRTAAVESLGYLTGKDFGLDVAAWKAWWRTRDETQAIDEALADGEGEGGAGAPKEDERRYAHELPARTIRPYYFGIPVRGSTVAFVFDVSASMRYKLPLAFDQLTRAVCGLPSTSRFEVIFFNEQVWPWRGRLSHADPVTKALLVAHLPEIKIRSYTNLFDSIEQALELEVEEIFVISDGEPNRGRRQLPRDILSELKRLNTHGTRIHTVSIVRVVDGDDHVRLLAKIAEENGGEHVERTLK